MSAQAVALYQDSPYAQGIGEARVYGGPQTQFRGRPKYDSRYARFYARKLLEHVGAYAELEEEMRADGQGLRQDAGLSLAFARSLEYIIRKPYEAEYPELRATEFLPVMTEVSPEALSFTYRMLDKVGQAAIIQENGSDAPKVDIKGAEWQSPVVTIGASYDYTILDTARAEALGVPLEAYKAETARFACEYLLEVIAAVGAPNSGVPGFTNAPGITSSAQLSSAGVNWMQNIANIGSASSTNNTVPALVAVQQIAADINNAIYNVFTNTKGIHRPDTVLVGVAAYSALMTAPRSPGFTADTILDYLENLCQVDIECWPQLDTAGAVQTTGPNGATHQGRVMVYKKDPKLLNLVIPQPWTQLPPQPIRMAWEITSYLRTGGVTVRYPKSVTYIDGVS
jgi:hypothetical protein